MSKIPGRPNFDYSAHQRADNPLYQKTTPLRPKFERERCPYNAMQMDDLKKTEAQRRFEAMRKEQMVPQDQAKTRGSRMVEQDRPAPQLKPRPALAASVDRSAFVQKEAAERSAASEHQRAISHSSAAHRETVKAQSIRTQSFEAFKEARSTQTQSVVRTRER